MPLSLRACFFVVDIGFILYWLTSLTGAIPDAWLFKDHDNPILHAWNWSFLPLDLFISATGLGSIWLYRRGSESWPRWALVSLVLTFCSGLQALSFWALRSDFDLIWWLPNGFLMVYPLLFIPGFLRTAPEAADPS